MSQNILILTKNYPPQVGGMEKYAFDLQGQLKEKWNNIQLISAWPRNEWLLRNSGIIESNMHTNFLLKIVEKVCQYFWKICYLMSEFFRLFFFVIRAVVLGFFWGIKVRNNNLIWSIDGSIAWLWIFIAKIAQTKTRVTLHGTDVVWNNNIYQKIMPKFWRMTDEIFVISKVIEHEAKKRKIPWNKIFLREHSLITIHLPSPWIFNKDVFLQSYCVPKDKIILFSIGRFIELKWFHWFISEVLPKIEGPFHYVLAGFGPLESLYKKIIKEKSIQNITLIWPIKDDVEKARWYTVADYFIMPNIAQGWLEWFGIVLLESQFYGKKSIVSSSVWSAPDEWWNNFILKSGNSNQWIDFINRLK